MNLKWPVTFILVFITTILLFLFSKAVLFSLFFLFIEWFWPSIRAKLTLNILYLRYISIDFLVFGSIILGYFYGPFFGIFVPLVMGIVQTIHEEYMGFGFHGTYILTSMMTGLLASALSTISFGTAGIMLLIFRYASEYLINYFRGAFSLFRLPHNLFNILFFGALFTNYENGLIKIFKK